MIQKSFGLQLGLAILFFCVGLSVSIVWYFYSTTSALVFQQVTGKLRDLSKLSSFLFDESAREDIEKLRTWVDQDAIKAKVQLEQLPLGGALLSLSPANIKKYQATPEFKRLVQILRKINVSSRAELEPLLQNYPQAFKTYPSAILPYIMVATPESPDRKIVKFLVSFAPDPEGTQWQGNPIGNWYKVTDDFYETAFRGKTRVADAYFTDVFYTSLTGAVPLKAADGRVIAVLGLDYQQGSEADELQRLQIICYTIIAASLLLSVFLATVAARSFTAPLKALEIAALGVRDQNFNTRVPENRADEFGFLGRVFNQMVVSVQQATLQLEQKNLELEARVRERTFELETANSQLEAQVHVDGLTQIFNRRYFDSSLQREWQAMLLQKNNLALILIDVDQFKPYNDTYGHLLGDDCLRQVAQVLQKNMAQRQLVARYGGEEFVVLLPNTTTQAALEVAQKLRLAVEQLALPHKASSLSEVVTISLGLVVLEPQANQKPQIMIELADQALYRAKNLGRNQVKIHLPTQVVID